MAINMENVEKATELLKDEDFLKKFIAFDDADAVIALYKENGATITAEELKTIGTLLKNCEDDDGEIPDELAEQVASGGAFDNITSTVDIIKELFEGLKVPLNRAFELFGLEIEVYRTGNHAH